MSNDWSHNDNVGSPKTRCNEAIPLVYIFFLVSHMKQYGTVLWLSQETSGTNHMQLRRQRRSRIPDKPNYSLNLWSIMKNCIGKDLSKIPMPVTATNVATTKQWFAF